MRDDDLISTWPPGYRHALLYISMAKRALATPGTPLNEQMKLLQDINSTIDLFISREMIEVIEPATDIEVRMYGAAASLDGDAKLSPSFDILAKSFREFCAVNPSFVTALRLGEGQKAQMTTKMPSAEKTDPIGSPPVSYSEPAATSIPPKPEAKNSPEPLPPMPGAAPWRHPLGT